MTTIPATQADADVRSADDQTIADLVRRLGPLEAIEALAGSLMNLLALRNAPDAEIEAIAKIEHDAVHRRRQARLAEARSAS